MEKYNYDLLIKDVLVGREVEFTYKKNLYGIMHFSQGWIFICNNKGISKYYKNSLELINTIKIDGKTIKELFNNDEILNNEISIY